MKLPFRNFALLIFCLIATAASTVAAQSGHSVKNNDNSGMVISVSAARTDNSTEPVRIENLSLYENGVEQKIKNLAFDPSPSRIVMMVDNSQTIRPDAEKLKAAVMEFAYEIFEGDQLFVIAFDEKPEIIQEWSDDAKKIETALTTFRKQGNPHLFDALSAGVNEVLLPLMPGTRKTAVVLLSDGLDRGSSMDFEKTLAELQRNDVVVYALQIPDRTGGAFRRNQPKANEVITRLTEGTGGKIFDFEDPQTAAKAICDELRKTRYLLSYSPTNTSSYDARNLFLIGNEGIAVRTRNANPPNVK